MADFNASNYAKTLAVPRQFIGAGDYGGEVRGVFDTYTTLGTETTADKIFVGHLLPGQRYIGGTIVYGSMGSGITFSLGDAGDDDRFMAAGSVASAGSKDAYALAGFGYRNVTGDPIPVFLTVGGGTVAAGIKVSVSMLFQGV